MIKIKPKTRSRSGDKSWKDKVDIVHKSFLRASQSKSFAGYFYRTMFSLNPQISEYFVNTNFDNQRVLLMDGLKYLFGFLNKNDENSTTNIIRLTRIHAQKNLNIRPHYYYYWTEALILTAMKFDPSWNKEMEKQWREVINFPITFFISQYFGENSL